MKFTLASVVALATLVSAQSISDIPSCALPCLTASVKKETSCSETDFACICKSDNYSKVQGDAASCVTSACGDKVSDVLSAVSKLCTAASSGGGSTASLTSGPTSAPSSTPSRASTTAPTTAPTTALASGTSPSTTIVAGAPGLSPADGLVILALGAALVL